jgi:hypothetical protein
MTKRWTPEAAARLGFLAAPPRAGGISFGLGGGQTAVQLTPEDRDMLTAAAAERGVSVLALTTALMHGVLGGRPVDAVLDDRGGASRREPLP